MQESTLEIHTIETDEFVDVISIKGPKKSDLHSRQGFFVSDTGSLFLAGPHRLEIVLRKEAKLSREAFEEKKDFIAEKIMQLSYRKKKVDVPIEREEPKSKDCIYPWPIIWPPNFSSLFNVDSSVFDADKVADKTKGTEPRMKKRRKENKGIIVTISDDPFPEVTYIRALAPEKLPEAYLNSYLPKVWLSRDRLLWGPDLILLQKGIPYSYLEISNALLHIRLAGEHLAAINKLEKPDLKRCRAVTFKDGKLKSSPQR